MLNFNLNTVKEIALIAAASMVGLYIYTVISPKINL